MFDSHDDDFVLNGFLVGLVVYIFVNYVVFSFSFSGMDILA